LTPARIVAGWRGEGGGLGQVTGGAAGTGVVRDRVELGGQPQRQQVALPCGHQPKPRRREAMSSA